MRISDLPSRSDQLSSLRGPGCEVRRVPQRCELATFGSPRAYVPATRSVTKYSWSVRVASGGRGSEAIGWLDRGLRAADETTPNREPSMLAPLPSGGEPVESLLRRARYFVPGKPSADYREVHRSDALTDRDMNVKWVAFVAMVGFRASPSAISSPSPCRECLVSGDREPVPHVDRGDSHEQVNDLLRGEATGQFRPHGIWHAAVRDKGRSLGERQRSSLALGEQRGCFPPGTEDIEPTLVLPTDTGIACVHVQAVGTAVELGGPDFDQLIELAIEAAGAHVAFEPEPEHGFGCAWVD